MIGLDSTPGLVVFRLTTSTPLFSFRCIYLASRQEVFRNETVASATVACWIRPLSMTSSRIPNTIELPCNKSHQYKRRMSLL
jgi:hypothetical protein